MEEYREWSATVDQVITPMQDSVIRFAPFRILGSDPEGSSVQIVEDIEVDSWEEFQKMLVESEPMRTVQEGFQRMADQSSVVTLYGDRVK